MRHPGRSVDAASSAAMSTQVDIIAYCSGLLLSLGLAGCSLINASREAPADASAPADGATSPTPDTGPPAADASVVRDTGPTTCTPRDCAAAGADCGEPSDGCVGFLDCGDCAWPRSCGGGGTPFRCGRPSACINAGAVCGYTSDGADLVNCGDCEDGEICGVPAPGTCGRPAACVALGRRCGPLADGGGTVWCGQCALGQACNPTGDCAAVPRAFCFEPGSHRMDSIVEVAARSFGSAVAELGRLWLYATTEHFRTYEGDPACNRMARMPMLDLVTASIAAIEPVLTSTFVQQPGMCADIDCRGWLSMPQLRRDGLEMFFHTSYPCAVWEDREIYLAYRLADGAPWRTPRFVPLSTPGDTPWDPVLYPVLLADARTLVYLDGNAQAVFKYARRRTSTPGDVSFQGLGPVMLRDPYPDGSHPQSMSPRSLSCDGAHLIYGRRTAADQQYEARIAKIRSTNPLVFGSPRAYGDGFSPAEAIVESPDCSVVYHAGPASLLEYRRIIRCP